MTASDSGAASAPVTENGVGVPAGPDGATGPVAPTSVPARPARRGRLVVLVGPSAVGKSSVVRRVRELLPDLYFSVSATTRAPRDGEVDGRDYRFVSTDDFNQMIDGGDLLEWAEIHGGLQRSGTPARPVFDALAEGTPTLVEVDIAGARAISSRVAAAITVFLTPPSWAELVSRLTGRGTESPEVIARRLATAREELAHTEEFDYVFVNDDVDRVAHELVSLLVGRDSGECTGGTAAS